MEQITREEENEKVKESSFVKRDDFKVIQGRVENEARSCKCP